MATPWLSFNVRYAIYLKMESAISGNLKSRSDTAQPEMYTIYGLLPVNGSSRDRYTNVKEKVLI